MTVLILDIKNGFLPFVHRLTLSLTFLIYTVDDLQHKPSTKKWPPVLAFNYILTQASFWANDPVNQLIIFSHTLNVINWHTSHISQCQNLIDWKSINHKSSNIFVFLIYVTILLCLFYWYKHLSIRMIQKVTAPHNWKMHHKCSIQRILVITA